MGFQPGNKANPYGRPKGSKNKNYLSLKYWFELIADNANGLGRKERVEIGFRAAALLLPKVQSLPIDPAESAQNAEAAMKLMEEATATINTSPTEETNGTKPNPSADPAAGN